jgi:hypothetical protein
MDVNVPEERDINLKRNSYTPILELFWISYCVCVCARARDSIYIYILDLW